LAYNQTFLNIFHFLSILNGIKNYANVIISSTLILWALEPNEQHTQNMWKLDNEFFQKMKFYFIISFFPISYSFWMIYKVMGVPS
jgi:hypothetical protein